ncbi:hypothetical protein O6H91_07G089300 [Diphasiastrum complanatum]|uniref:Uncharacterized protein n=1 Tax=Diphasiastrum complanatum TaxID=34168 RepID=A0ACC2D7C0_DIPCM|nr:hypothetical protein O6H91_07G089300 [Diphasiastrum complanatum]
MKAVVGSSKSVCLPLSSAMSSDGFKTANSSSVVSCKLWGHSRLDSRAILVFSRSRTAALGEFSDQSHLQFYAKIVCEKKEKKSKGKHTSVNASIKEILQVCDSGLQAEVADGSDVCCEKIDAIEAAVKQLKALEDELKAKKQELKAKKKEMKAATKAKKESKCDSSSSSSESSDTEDEMCMDKMRMQSEQYEEMKAEMKAEKKSKCDSSSSSSESSDCENEMSMDKIRMQSQLPIVIDPSSTPTARVLSQIAQPPSQSINLLPFTVPMKENLISDALYTSGSFLLGAEPSLNPALAKSSGRVEVCTGGKCRKDGSQQVLSAFQECIPATSGVAISACKCMGKCGKGPNVRVHSGDDESNPQVYTAVSEEDTKFLAHYHFGVTPEQGIPVVSVLKADSVATDSSMCAA